MGNLPCGQQHPARNLEGDTVVSILNTIHEVITDSPENARALIQGHAVQKLVAINKSRYSETQQQPQQKRPTTLLNNVQGANSLIVLTFFLLIFI